LARNSRAGTMYETIQEIDSKTSSNGDMAKVEETLLFTREVNNSCTVITFSKMFYFLLSVIYVLVN